MMSRASLRAIAQRFGWPGGLALVLSLAALGWGLWLDGEDAALQQRREALAQQRTELARQHRHAALQPAGSQADFVASFPDDAQRQARTAALLALAADQGLPWPRSDFSYRADAALGLAQYRISMSLSGSYVQIRSYVAEALRRDPALALEGLRLRRGQPGAPELSAELSWVLHMRLPAAEPQS